MTFWHHHEGNIQRRIAIRSRTGNLKRQHLNFPWPPYQSSERKDCVSSVPTGRCAFESPNSVSNSTVLSNTAARVLDMLRIQWVTIMKLVWVKGWLLSWMFHYMPAQEQDVSFRQVLTQFSLVETSFYSHEINKWGHVKAAAHLAPGNFFVNVGAGKKSQRVRPSS